MVDDLPASNYAGCHHDVEAPIDADNHGVLFLNSHISGDDIPDGAAHTIFIGEKIVADDDLGWMSGTRATLRNTGLRINWRAGPSGRGSRIAAGRLGNLPARRGRFCQPSSRRRDLRFGRRQRAVHQRRDRSDGLRAFGKPSGRPTDRRSVCALTGDW